MNLYTQEQLDLAFLKGYSLGGLGFKYTLEIVEDMRKELTPIELPSDREIDNASLMISEERKEFIKGAKYVINKIQGGNNEQ